MELSDLRMPYRKLRAPREPNTALIEPSPSLIGSVIANNRKTLASAHAVEFGGLSLGQLSAKARAHLHASALQFTGQYRSLSAYPNEMPETLILSGHQPELFHPGVWFKQAALSQWSREQRAVGIQILIDSDLCRTTSIRVPTGTRNAPTVVEVPFDRPTAPVTFEERGIQDILRFGSFDQRVQSAIESLVPDPLVANLWRFAREAAHSGCGLGQAIAQARHRLEGTWGFETLELPWSKVCDTDSFRRFLVAILARLADFQAIHNQVLRAYRNLHKIRGRSRPVAELMTRDGDWMEAPFWCWSTDDPRRRPLLVQSGGSGLMIRAEGTQRTVHLDDDVDLAVEQLAAARAQGFKVRSRALVTTMYARLVLGDVFLHGIGGAKYDELTDVIIRWFWGIAPPDYVVLSATIPLPIQGPSAKEEDLRRIDGRLRDLWYHPEKHVDITDRNSTVREECDRLIQEKSRWIKMVASSEEPGTAKRRYVGIVSTTASLREHVKSLRASLLAERKRLVRDLRQSALLSSREYSFCLFPENSLRQTLIDLLE